MYGRPARGSPGDQPLNHATGDGWVAEKHGYYRDALYKKNNQVVLLLIETFGRFGIGLQRQLLFWRRIVKDLKRGRDSTKTSDINSHLYNYLAHHTRAISSAVVLGNAVAIDDEIAALQKTLSSTPSGATLGDFM